MPRLDQIRELLNQRTDYLINWNRVGSLFFSNHRYSTQELLERSFIISATAIGGFLAWNQSEGNSTTLAFGASLGFLLAHTATLSPLIYKRLQTKWACEEHIKTINSHLNDEMSECSSLVKQTMDKIMNYTPEQTSPSAIWGKRERLLKNLEAWITEEDCSNLTHILSKDDIITLLENNTGYNPESPQNY